VVCAWLVICLTPSVDSTPRDSLALARLLSRMRILRVLNETNPSRVRAPCEKGKSMTCATIMTPHPRSVRVSETIGHAAEKIIADHSLSVPVVDSGGRLVGLFGIYDLLALLVPRVAVIGNLLPNLRFIGDDVGDLHKKFMALRDSPVERAINREAVRVYPDTPVIEAIRLFCGNHTTIPVVERNSGVLVGLISYWDAAKLIAKDSA
jgi:CBS-domain-containing membrane protein